MKKIRALMAFLFLFLIFCCNQPSEMSADENSRNLSREKRQIKAGLGGQMIQLYGYETEDGSLISDCFKKVKGITGVPNYNINYNIVTTDQIGKTIIKSCDDKIILIDEDLLSKWKDASNSLAPYYMVISHEFAHYFYEHQKSNSNYIIDEFEADLFSGKTLRSLNFSFEEIKQTMDGLFNSGILSSLSHYNTINIKKSSVELGWLFKELELISNTPCVDAPRISTVQDQIINIQGYLKDNLNKTSDSRYFNNFFPIYDERLKQPENTRTTILDTSEINFSAPYNTLLVFNKNYQEYWSDGSSIFKFNSTEEIDTIGSIKKIFKNKLLSKEIEIYDNKFYINKKGYVFEIADSLGDEPIGLFINKNNYKQK